VQNSRTGLTVTNVDETPIVKVNDNETRPYNVGVNWIVKM